MSYKVSARKQKAAKKAIDIYKNGKEVDGKRVFYSIDSCADSQGIKPRTFYDYLDRNAELAEYYKKAKEERWENRRGRLMEIGLTSLEKKLTGFEYTEIKQEGKKDEQGNLQVEKIIQTRKYFAPSDTMIIFSLTNFDPANFKHRNHITHDGLAEPTETRVELPDGTVVTL